MDDAFARDWLSCSIRPLLKPGGLVSAGAGFRKRLPQHPHWTLLLGLSGNCHFEGPRRSGIITDSSACLLPPFTPGELSATQPMTYYVVCFDVLTRKGRDPLADLQLPAVIPLRDGELMRRHCQEMLGLAADYAFRDAPARVRGRAVIDRMLADVLADGFALGVLQSMRQRPPAWFAAALDWLDRHALQAHCNLPTLSRNAGCSPAHLVRTFRACLDETPIGRRDRLRLEWAARTLTEQPAISVAEVARRCRFSHSTAFSRAFRRRFGIAPRDWVRGGASHRGDG